MIQPNIDSGIDSVELVRKLDAKFSPNFDAYVSGEIEESQLKCALCESSHCVCPPFGSPEYFALIDKRHGRSGTTATATDHNGR